MNIKKYSIEISDANSYNKKHLITSDEGTLVVTNTLVINVGTKLEKNILHCEGILTQSDGITYINPPKKIRGIKRHLMKSVSWRILGTIDTMILAWIVSGDPTIGLKVGFLEVFTKITLYFFHERAWYKFYKEK